MASGRSQLRSCKSKRELCLLRGLQLKHAKQGLRHPIIEAGHRLGYIWLQYLGVSETFT
ncbi:predicted protein [Botrytis cinerea T4]|uniref:Uncharacterized protein n=1 Tax=Botryotinia fuckeliana (strain T4) TaxID=999810 RepID=G2YPC5_BOTF4|nr:predicted protein [Botrytis cinerea T4]